MMNFIKQYLIAAFFLLSSPSIAQHSFPVKNIRADSIWSKLYTELRTRKNDFESTQEAFLRFREEGLKFWKMFPKDPRKYHWLITTLTHGKYLNYWEIKLGDESYSRFLKKKQLHPISYSWPLNKKSLQEWEVIYPDLISEILIYFSNNPSLNYNGTPGVIPEIALLADRLNEFLHLSLNKEYRKNGKINLGKLFDLFVETGKYLKKEDINKPTRMQKAVFGLMNRCFLARYNELGLNSVDINGFLNSIKSSSSPILRSWAIQQHTLFALEETPLLLRYRSIDDNIIDLSKMRGKVVLVDFWSLSCSACIDRMPAIKTIYDKYKSQGFEVISACIENEDKLSKIKEIEEKIGSDWPILLIGAVATKGSLGQSLFHRYGFWGLPQLLLLDKQGKLAMLNDKLRNGDFEPDVKKLLTENYKSN